MRWQWSGPIRGPPRPFPSPVGLLQARLVFDGGTIDWPTGSRVTRAKIRTLSPNEPLRTLPLLVRQLSLIVNNLGLLVSLEREPFSLTERRGEQGSRRRGDQQSVSSTFCPLFRSGRTGSAFLPAGPTESRRLPAGPTEGRRFCWPVLCWCDRRSEQVKSSSGRASSFIAGVMGSGEEKRSEER